MPTEQDLAAHNFPLAATIKMKSGQRPIAHSLQSLLVMGQSPKGRLSLEDPCHLINRHYDLPQIYQLHHLNHHLSLGQTDHYLTLPNMIENLARHTRANQMLRR